MSKYNKNTGRRPVTITRTMSAGFWETTPSISKVISDHGLLLLSPEAFLSGRPDQFLPVWPMSWKYLQPSPLQIRLLDTGGRKGLKAGQERHQRSFEGLCKRLAFCLVLRFIFIKCYFVAAFLLKGLSSSVLQKKPGAPPE